MFRSLVEYHHDAPRFEQTRGVPKEHARSSDTHISFTYKNILTRFGAEQASFRIRSDHSYGSPARHRGANQRHHVTQRVHRQATPSKRDERSYVDAVGSEQSNEVQRAKSAFLFRARV